MVSTYVYKSHLKLQEQALARSSRETLQPVRLCPDGETLASRNNL